MRHHRNRGQKRRGALVPLAALLMIPVMGMCAFSIDAGYIVLVQTDLQNAADAGALAGAEQLQNLYAQYTAPLANTQSIMTTATTNVAQSGTYGTNTGNSAFVPGSPMWMAEHIAGLNKAGGVSLTVPDADVTLGYTDANGTYTSTLGTNFPNTITVVTRRDTTANNPIDLFFGPVYNKSQQSLTATATATIYAGNVSSLQVIPGVDAHVLPVAYDYQMWQTFASTGQSPDGIVHYDTDTGADSLGNGKPQLMVYPYYTTPGGNNSSGSFGLVDVGPPSNNTPAFRNWIDTGETPNDIQYLINNNLVPVSLDTSNGQPGPKDWKVGPGLKSTLVTNFQSIIGEPAAVPLFEPVSGWNSGQPYQAAGGNGSNATYQIVGFAAVTVSEAVGNGNNMTIYLQPMALIDPTDIILNPQPAGTGTTTLPGTPQTTFISAKLTR
jgi:Flp pilus assembly protein TadG